MSNDMLMKNINEYLNRNKIAKRDFEKSIGVSTGYFARIVSNNTTPSIEVLMNISNIMNHTIDELIYLDIYDSNNTTFLYQFLDKLINLTKNKIIKWNDINKDKLANKYYNAVLYDDIVTIKSESTNDDDIIYNISFGCTHDDNTPVVIEKTTDHCCIRNVLLYKKCTELLLYIEIYSTDIDLNEDQIKHINSILNN